MSNVFVYGTLMFPEVLQTLIQRQPQSHPAIVKGYTRYALKGQVFPGVIPTPGATTVQGLILYHLTPEELEIFDEFEGDEYVKTPVKAELLENQSDVVDCDMYVWKDSLRSMLKNEPWDPAIFRTEHLSLYTVMCKGFVDEFREIKKAPGNRPFAWGDAQQ